MDRRPSPKYTGAELARFPLIFGAVLLGISTAFYFRKSILPSATEAELKSLRGSEADRELLRDAINKSIR